MANRVEVYDLDRNGNRKWLCWFDRRKAKRFPVTGLAWAGQEEFLYITNLAAGPRRRRFLVHRIERQAATDVLVWREVSLDDVQDYCRRNPGFFADEILAVLPRLCQEEFPARFTMQLRAEEKEAWGRAAAAAGMSLAAWIRWVVNAAYEEVTQ